MLIALLESYVENLKFYGRIAVGPDFVIHSILKKRKRKRKKRRWWQTNVFKSRSIYSGSSLINDLRSQEINEQFNNFIRMSSVDFEYLINLSGPKIARMDITFRKAISVQERLAVTLRYLATGDSYSSLQYLFKIFRQMIGFIVPEIYQAIVEALKENIQLFALVKRGSELELVPEKAIEGEWRGSSSVVAAAAKELNISNALFNIISSSLSTFVFFFFAQVVCPNSGVKDESWFCSLSS
ncbi:hypothetical protein QTP88_011759 [Uroleucon formosanum]